MAFFDKFRRRAGPRDELSEIAENVGRILAARRGFGAIDERFGLSDPSASTSRAHLAEVLAGEVAETLRLFEPRVEIAELVEVAGGTGPALRFRLTCRLRGGPKSLYLVYDRETNRLVLEPTDEAGQ